MNNLSINLKTAIIINPLLAGGGDKALGRKVNACFNDNGYTTKFIIIDVSKIHSFSIRNCNTHKTITDYSIKQIRDFIKNDADKTAFNNSLIVITPLNKNENFYISKIIDELQKHYKFKKDNLLIIDELGSSTVNPTLTPNNKLPYEEFKEQLGFKYITDRSLGFDSNKQQIGYFSLDKNELELIDKSYKNSLKLLFDSFNFDLNIVNDMLLFGYISSDYIDSVFTLIDNSLIELESLDKYKNATSINYVLLFRLTDIIGESKYIIDCFTGKEKEKYAIEENNIDFYLCHYEDFIITDRKNKRYYNYYYYDNLEYKSRVMLLHQHKPNSKKAPQINIFMVSGTIKLPTEIFMQFIKLSDMGIMTGDHSLFEYMSIKKELPYYDMQYWKKRFVDNLLDQAQESNIDSLKNYYAAKFLGMESPRKRKFNIIDMSVSLGIPQERRSKQDIRNDTIKKLVNINKQKQKFEAKLLKQDARYFIKEYLQNTSMLSLS